MSTVADQSRAFLQQKSIHSQWLSDYLNPDMDSFFDLAFYDIIRRLGIKPGDALLDAGCGYCYHATRLARSGAKITAVDFSSPALDEAANTIKDAGIEQQVTLQQADLTSLPFPNASFDFVVSWGVLMHIPELETALCELARVLKPGGTLVLSEINMRSPDIFIREKAIHLLKKVLRKDNAVMTRTPRGIEVWKENLDGSGLMVRKTDMEFLTSFLLSQGLTQIERTPCELTQVFTNLPTRALRRAIYALNRFYFRYSLPAIFAVGNIIYFSKHQGVK
jgi:2-polyprenyl-3-methyl-5-hydroxy-6-metoxy-1,4-benzoquinol methylase